MKHWVLGVLIAALVAPSAADAASLRAGVGRSDVEPPTGFPTMGYVRSDAIARGQHTRLFARAIVLQSGDRKLALVATDLGFTPGGLVSEVAARLASRGFSERNIVISASHTHSGPAGFATFQSDNFVAPTMGTPGQFDVEGDTRLYGFLIERVALAIVRADMNLGPAKAAWGSGTLDGVTDNRSLEAHLADHGFDLPYGTGKVSQDPGGYRHTIDDDVDVLRVDRVAGKRSYPIGGWLSFADHGTVNPYTFGVYNADHHGPAERLFERALRRSARVPAGQDVVGAYGNADAGDMTAGLRGRGPAFAEEVGSREADAFLGAWRRAGRSLSASPELDLRWTRSCFCGRTVEGGQVADSPRMGQPFLTGSEESRGPLFDVTGQQYEGVRLPAGAGPQGRKIGVLGPPEADFPGAIPLLVARIGDHLLATIPGEASAEVGRRIRAKVLAAGGPGIAGVSLAGYANEYVHYFVTPEEYDMQHYEGGSTLFGKYSSNLVMDDLGTLAGDLAGGRAAPAPVDFDPRNGVVPDTRPYDAGATSGTPVTQQLPVPRLTRAEFSWQGGERGFDRPLDRAFVTIERRDARGRWGAVTDDLGLEILWRVDDAGRYTASWQVPLDATLGRYRFVVTGNRYRLASSPFGVLRSPNLTVRTLSPNRVALEYPKPDPLTDLTNWPAQAVGGQVRAAVGKRTVSVRRVIGTVFSLPRGARVLSARDRFGNTT